MNSAEKEALFRGWDRIENSAIVKDVATKGKYINLAITFLAKRMNLSIDATKIYFRTEVDEYVRRLLSNGQVFRAEHLLKNFNRISKYVVYEFYAGLTDVVAESMPTESGHSNGSSCANIILAYLNNIEDNFEVQRLELDMSLKMLKTVADDRNLREKYASRLERFSLEEIYKKEEEFRVEMAADIFFITKHTFVVPRLQKTQVWSYLINRKLFGLIIKWIHLLSAEEIESGSKQSQFDIDLCVMFRHWALSEAMLEELRRSGVSISIRDSLARHGMFLEDERNQMQVVLERTFVTDSWKQNRLHLQSGLMQRYIVDMVLEHGLSPILMQNICSLNELSEIRDKYPDETENISLCVAMRSADIKNVHDLSVEVSKYLIKHDAEFYNKNPYIYLSEVILNNTAPSPDGFTSFSADEILVKIPYVKSLLSKCINSKTTTDHTATLSDMVKRFLKIDLRQMQQEADAELIDFSNPVLIAKYGSPEKLGFLYYVKQCRSAFAVFVFAMEQLRQFSQISKGQIVYACSLVTNIALGQLDNKDLVSHCMAFMEMLGIDSTGIRARLQCVRLVNEAKPEVKLNELTEVEFQVELVKAVLANPIAKNVNALRIVGQATRKMFPNSVVKKTFDGAGWFRLLAVASYFEFSLENVLSVLCECHIDGISPNMATNLVLALRYDGVSERPRRSGNVFRRRNIRHEGNMVASGDTLSSSISSTENMGQSKLVPSKFLEERSDLFATILQCTATPSASASSSTSYEEEQLDLTKFLELFSTNTTNTVDLSSSTSLNLMRKSIQMRWPILAVLSATTNPEHRDYCWFIWLALSTSATSPKDTNEFKEIALNLLQDCVSSGYVTALHQSFQIFFPESIFRMFTEYLHRTKSLDFSEESTECLRSFLESFEHNTDLVHIEWLPPNAMMKLSTSLLMQHIKCNVESSEHRQYLLDSLCESGIGNHVNMVDFCTLKEINSIISFTGIELNVDLFVRDRYTDHQIRAEYGRICDSLVNQQQFSKAMKLADWLAFPKDNIIYESWVWEWETCASAFDLAQCERDMITFSLAPELVINFYTLVADKLVFGNPQKYRVLKRILDVIKRHNIFPNESFDCDRIEYDMVLSYLRNGQTIEELDVYYSDYFESIMAKERFVLYKSFGELKDISGLDDLTVCNKRPLNAQEALKLDDLIYKLLDDGDIVQALRLQAIFLHRPVDLHYLVFCMALAEGLASLNDLTPEQEQLNRDATKFAASRFNRRTLRPNLIGQSSASSSPAKPNFLDTSDNSVVLEFEEIPSRHKQDILNALQNFAARINHGFRIAQRIMMIWRASMYLDKEYVDVLKTKDAYLLLESATSEDCLYKLDVMNDIMTSLAMTKQECADFLADKIAEAIVQSKFYIIQQNSQHTMNPQDGQNLWGYDLDKQFRLFLELCPSTAALGNRLLKHCDAIKIYRKIDTTKPATPQKTKEEPAIQEIVAHLTVILHQKILSHKKQNTICVELLIKAHECFVHECYMEGIAWVLHRTKMLNVVLSNAKSWSLIVKMLMGIGRYREMYYCFETLIKNDQFESLLGKFDQDRIGGLKQAIISYLRDHCPNSGEYYLLTALHFCMYKEIAQKWEAEARTAVASVLVESQLRMDEHGAMIPSYKHMPVDETTPNTAAFHLRCSPDLVDKLNVAMDRYANAAQEYLADHKLAMAQTTANLAELVALQICLVRRAVETMTASSHPNVSPPSNSTVDASLCQCVCVLNIVSASMMKFVVNNFLSVPQALILSRVYPFEINWTDALYTHYIQGDNETFLTEFCDRLELTESMIEVLVKTFQHQAAVTPKMEANIARLVEMVDSVTLRYRLASLLGLKRCIAGLINDHSLYYLKDTNYGRSEMPDK